MDRVRSMHASTELPPTARKLKGFYFLHFMGVGIYYPFLAPYLRGLGFDGDAIGTAQMAGAIAAVPGALLWGALADRLRAPTRALQWASRGALVAAVLLVFARTPREVALVWLAYGLVTPSIVPLLDTVTIESIRSQAGGAARHQPRRGGGASYARIRLWGSLGFIATAQGFGMLLASRGDRPGDPSMPLAYACAVLGFTVAANLAPPTPLPAGPKPHLKEAVALLANRRLLLLLGAGAVHSATTASYQLLGVLVRDDGLPATVTGAGMAFGVSAEVLALFAYPALERRFTRGTLLASAFAGTALRWLLLARCHSATALVALQGLHSLTFGLYWAAAIRMLEHLVPSHLRATGQTLYSAATFAVGGAVGYRLAGYGYDRLGGARPVYFWSALVELVPVVLALALRRRER